jgi:hypothetical protein
MQVPASPSPTPLSHIHRLYFPFPFPFCFGAEAGVTEVAVSVATVARVGWAAFCTPRILARVTNVMPEEKWSKMEGGRGECWCKGLWSTSNSLK